MNKPVYRDFYVHKSHNCRCQQKTLEILLRSQHCAMIKSLFNVVSPPQHCIYHKHSHSLHTIITPMGARWSRKTPGKQAITAGFFSQNKHPTHTFTNTIHRFNTYSYDWRRKPLNWLRISLLFFFSGQNWKTVVMVCEE